MLSTGRSISIKKICKSVEQKMCFTVSEYRQFTVNSEYPYYVTSKFIGGLFSHDIKLIKHNMNPK